jgi:chromate transporter
MKNVLRIAFAFGKVGALTFGGGYAMLPILRRELGANRGWATDEEIMDAFALAQCLPGIIAVNCAMLLGWRRGKLPGLAAAALGMVTPSVAVILLVARFLNVFAGNPWVARAFGGIRAAVLALVVNVGVGLWKTGVRDWFGVIFFILALAGFVALHVSPVAVVVLGALCGVVLRERRKPE